MGLFLDYAHTDLWARMLTDFTDFYIISCRKRLDLHWHLASPRVYRIALIRQRGKIRQPERVTSPEPPPQQAPRIDTPVRQPAPVHHIHTDHPSVLLDRKVLSASVSLIGIVKNIVRAESARAKAMGRQPQAVSARTIFFPIPIH